MNNTELADLIETAADKLELCPWGQGILRHQAGGICAQDAIHLAAMGAHSISEATQTMIRWQESKDQLAIAEEGRRYTAVTVHLVRFLYDHPKWGAWGRYSGLFQWNDEPGRTKDEVIDLFREAAKDLRNKAVPEA